MPVHEHGDNYPEQLGGLDLPFVYEGPLTDERHGLQMNGLLIDGHPALLSEMIGSTEPLPVRISLTRLAVDADSVHEGRAAHGPGPAIDEKASGWAVYGYEGRVKVHMERLVLLDPHPANPAADWAVLENELGLSLFEQRALLRIEAAPDWHPSIRIRLAEEP